MRAGLVYLTGVIAAIMHANATRLIERLDKTAGAKFVPMVPVVIRILTVVLP